MIERGLSQNPEQRPTLQELLDACGEDPCFIDEQFVKEDIYVPPKESCIQKYPKPIICCLIMILAILISIVIYMNNKEFCSHGGELRKNGKCYTPVLVSKGSEECKAGKCVAQCPVGYLYV